MARPLLTLCIETSSPKGSIALLRGPELLAELTQDKPNAHAEELLPLLDRLLADAGVARRELARVAVGLGPGSFTGLRVGIALAQGIGVGLGVEVLGVPTLTCLAAALPRTDAVDAYCSLLDARRNEVFFAAFDGAHQELISPRTLPQEGVAEAVAQLLGERRGVVAGEAARAMLPETLHAAPGVADAPAARTVGALTELGIATSEVTPLYLRDADAKLPDLPPNPIAPG